MNLGALSLLNCTSCDAKLGSTPASRRKTTFCRKCAASAIAKDPAKRDKCRQAMLDVYARNPKKRAAQSIRAKDVWEKRFMDPAEREKSRAQGMLLTRPDIRARAVANAIETKMSWCPPAYRSQYKQTMRKNAMTAAEAREVTLLDIQADIATARTRIDCPQPLFFKARDAERWLNEKAKA